MKSLFALWLGPCLFCALIGSPAVAQRTETARIAGIVIDPQQQPVRRVIVTVTAAELPGGRSTISDDDGRFAFDQLPAGRFTISGARPAYLPAAYGATRPGGAGIPLQVAAGQQITDVRLTIARGAVIAGTLLDHSGEPASGIQIAAYRLPAPGGAMRLDVASIAVTDDRGMYRIFGLMPGEYLVATAVRLNSARDIAVMSPAQIDETLRALEQRAGRGTFSPAPATSTPRLAPGTYTFAPVFYPGTAAAADAVKIRLAAGEERTGLDFAIGVTRTATIAGTLRAADGAVPTAQFVINLIGLQLPSLLGSLPTFSTQAGSSERLFKYTNVAPGRYRISAQQSTANGVFFATADVDVAGDDISGVSLVLQPALRLSGRIVFDATTLPPPQNLSSVRVILSAAHELGSSSAGTTRMGGFNVPPAIVDADGRFEIGGIIPETYRLSATVPGGAGWWLRSAMIGGRDVLDHPFEIGLAGNLTGAVLTFSDRQTTLSGRLQTAAGAPAPPYFVAAFPSDRSLWRPQARRRLQTARAATDGTWIIKGLPAGEYFLAAFTDLDEMDLLDPAFLDRLAASAVKLTLGEGEQKVQDLRVGG